MRSYARQTKWLPSSARSFQRISCEPPRQPRRQRDEESAGTTHEQEQLEARGYLERIAEPLRTKSLKVQTRVLSHDQPAVAILDEVKARRADLVALATHGRSGLPRLFLGSVADKVVRGASVPVLAARAPTNP